MSDAAPGTDVSPVSIDEAVAEVQRWLDQGTDPEGIFAATGDQVIRFKDLIGHLRARTPDGDMLRLAIARGRMIRRERAAGVRGLLAIERREPPESREPRAASNDQPGIDQQAPVAEKTKTRAEESDHNEHT